MLAFRFKELREKQTHRPINHSRKPLPGAEGCHTFQHLVGDPGWHQELLRIAGAESVRAERQSEWQLNKEREGRGGYRVLIAQKKSLSMDTESRSGLFCCPGCSTSGVQ